MTSDHGPAPADRSVGREPAVPEEPGAWSTVAVVVVGLLFLIAVAAVVHALMATFA
ncbi:MAG: hypothetical protein PVH96_11970 [Gemmatimonadota bacterium]|jgi:hypothetical protein